MANWLGLAGGAAEGVLAGMQDNRQRELYNMYMRQQKREEEQRLAEDAAAAEVSARIKSAEAPQADMSGKGMTAGSLDQGDWSTTRAKVSPSQRLGIVADVQTASKVPKLQLQGAQLAAQATQLKGVERKEAEAEKRDAIYKKYLPQMDMIRDDPKRFLKEQGAQYYNGKVPDGKSVTILDTPDGGLSYAFIDDKTKAISGYRTIPQGELQDMAVDVADRMIGHELGATGDEGFTAQRAYREKQKELGIRKQTAESGAITAAAAMKNAETNEAHYGPGGTYAEAQRLGREAQLEAARIQARAYAARSPAESAKAAEWKDYKDTMDAYVEALKDPIKNKANIASLALRMAAYHPDKSIVSMPTGVDRDGNKTYAAVNRVSLLTREAFQNLGYDTLNDGSPLPKGMSAESFAGIQKTAADKKLQAGVTVIDNEPAIVFTNPKFPGRVFSTMDEAKNAKATPGIPGAPAAAASGRMSAEEYKAKYGAPQYGLGRRATANAMLSAQEAPLAPSLRED